MSDPTATVHTAALPGLTGSPRCQVVVLEGPGAGRAVALPLADGAVTLGTDPACELALTDDRVSRRHVSLQAVAGRFAVTDHDSTNGTLYEGALVHQSTAPLGATLKLGRSFVRVVPVARTLEVAPSTTSPRAATELLRRRGLEPGPIEGSGLDALMGHDCPGNVRALLRRHGLTVAE